MNVKIGPYPARLVCDIHKKFITRRHGFAYHSIDFKQSTFEDFVEKVDDIIQSIYNIVNVLYFDKKVQQTEIHIDRWDTWSMDTTLAHIIVPMLTQLKKNKHSAPGVELIDVPAELRPSPEQAEQAQKDNEIDTLHFDRWEWVLDEMIWAFSQLLLDDWEEQYYKRVDVGTVEDGSAEQVLKTRTKIVIRDEDGRKAHADRMANGFRLFGTYYCSLWD